jgi:hypothetical protein
MADRPDAANLNDLQDDYRRLMDRDKGGHLEQDQWEGLACGEMEPAEREPALEHVTGCRRCADVYRGLMLLGEEAHRFDPGAPRPTPARSHLWGRPPLWVQWATAAAVLTAAVLPFALRQRPAATPVSRAPAAQAGLVLLEPSGPVSGVSPRFVWRDVGAAEFYRVRLFRDDGVLLWTSEPLRESRADWPPSVPLSRGRYFWEVQAFREGKGVARSELAPFEWAP